jgi:hypothetical protein
MNLSERKVAIDETQLVTELLLHDFDDRIGLTAIGAFEIAALDERHRRGRWTLRVVIQADRRSQDRRLHDHRCDASLAGSASSALRMPSAPGLIPIGET